MRKRLAWLKFTDGSKDPAASSIIRLIYDNVWIWIICRFYYDRKSTFLGRVATLSLIKTVHLPPDLQNQYTAIIDNFCNTLQVDGVKTQVAGILIINHVPSLFTVKIPQDS